MKKLWIMILLMPLISVKIYANNQVFVWHNTTVEVPLHANIEDYLDMPYATLTEGLRDDNLYYIKNGINYTFISVINTSILKEYRLDYKVTSPKYNKSSVQSITFRIIDTEPPILTKGIMIEVPVKTTVIDYLKYIDYKDNYDAKSDISVTVDYQGINLNQIGLYKLHIILMDKSLNESRYVLLLHVKDYQCPVIVEKENPIINIGDTLDLNQFYVITDNYDQSPNVSLTDNEVNYQAIGSYPIRIDVYDQSGNHTYHETFLQIQDLLEPTLALKTNQLVISLNETVQLSDLIIKASDNYDSISVSDVLIDTDLNTNQVGHYEAIYELTDSSNNKTSYRMSIIVRDLIPPTFDIAPIKQDSYAAIDLNANIKVTDNSNLPVKWTLVETNLSEEPGEYQALYLAIDAFGNHSYHLRSITILENKPDQNPSLMRIAYVIIGGSVLSIAAFGIYYVKLKKS